MSLSENAHHVKVENTYDLEKNIRPLEPQTQLQARKKLALLTIIEIVSFVIVAKNREKINDFHQMLEPVLLGVISASLGQSIIQFTRPVNYSRVLKFFIWGGVNGTLTYIWIDFIVSNFDLLSHRVAMDLGIGIPLFQTLFLLFNSFWEGHSIKIVFMNSFFRTLIISYLLWSGVSIVCFGYLPQNLIFPVNCTVTLIWNVFLGLLT